MTKRTHYERVFEQCKSNIKDSWRNIRNLIDKNNISKTTSVFKVEEVTITDKSTIAKKFNEIFSSTGADLAAKIKPSNCSFKDYLNKVPRVENSFFFLLTNNEEIIDIVKSQKK